MEKFQSAGVAIDSLSSIKGFCTKFNPKNDLQAIYFKRYPIKNDEINKKLTLEALIAFHDTNVTNAVPYALQDLLEDPNIRFIVIVDKEFTIKGMAAFISSENGHVLIFIAIDNDLRHQNYGK